jgi:hypothetical protein
MDPRPPIGIYVLSGVLALCAIACGAAFFAVPGQLKLFVGVLVPILVLFSLGMAMRINVARLVLIQLLSVALVMEAALIFNSMRSDVPIRLPVLPAVVRISMTVWTLAYLVRRDVRAAFGAVETLASDNSGEPKTSNMTTEQVIVK